MSYEIAVEQFSNIILPLFLIAYGNNDKTATPIAWGLFLNSLKEKGKITNKQHKTWKAPERKLGN
jgi:hypothetical protein